MMATTRRPERLVLLVVAALALLAALCGAASHGVGAHAEGNSVQGVHTHDALALRAEWPGDLGSATTTLPDVLDVGESIVFERTAGNWPASCSASVAAASTAPLSAASRGVTLAARSKSIATDESLSVA